MKENSFKNNFIDFNYSINLTNDSYGYLVQDNTFIIFKSINEIIYLIYSTEKKSIILYDLIDYKKINEIKKAHENYITNFRHFLDIINKRDIIISISGQDNNLKLWNINNLECLININKLYNYGILSSAYILNENNQNYIITSNFNVWDSEAIKVYDFKGNKIKEINDNNSNDRTFFIDVYYDIKSSKNYIITGNYDYVKTYDYNNNKIYYKYCDYDKRFHYNIVIMRNENIVKLIEGGNGGIIRMWNFHTGLLLNKIVVGKGLRCICLWTDNYLLVGCNEDIRLLDLKKEIFIQIINCDNYNLISMKKMYLPKYGECLISQGINNNQIKLWTNKN